MNPLDHIILIHFTGGFITSIFFLCIKAQIEKKIVVGDIFIAFFIFLCGIVGLFSALIVFIVLCVNLNVVLWKSKK